MVSQKEPSTKGIMEREWGEVEQFGGWQSGPCYPQRGFIEKPEYFLLVLLLFYYYYYYYVLLR